MLIATNADTVIECDLGAVAQDGGRDMRTASP